MSLIINENAGILEINGSLNAQNTKSIKNYLEALINQSSFSITISLNKVVDIDKSGFDTIINLYKKALSKNKFVYIISDENKKIVALFRSEKLTSLLNSQVA
ncbi:STAS domain-containing protein [Flavobacterium sp. HNIBRBA15423]|uniref:STAS domain-containing protein n=1 Tax=Flavobacterium sp. HNIBRBA15423 TaxID=3458683 RepID=UPI004043A2F1